MKAVVVGAGIAGLVAARQLGLAGWDVEVLEKSAAPRPDGYMMDFFGPGVEAADRIGHAVLAITAVLAYGTVRFRMPADDERAQDQRRADALDLMATGVLGAAATKPGAFSATYAAP